MGLHGHRLPGLLTGELQGLGFRLERGVVGMPTPFPATWGEGQPLPGLWGAREAGVCQDVSRQGRSWFPGAAAPGGGDNG